MFRTQQRFHFIPYNLDPKNKRPASTLRKEAVGSEHSSKAILPLVKSF